MSWKDVFAFMRNLDNKGTSYKHEVVMARPVYHPLQSHTSYNLLGEDEVPTEAEVTI